MNSQLHKSSQVAEDISLKDADLLSLKNLKDAELLSSTKMLAQKERELTTEVIRHLAEIERRKLYCDLRYPSLFEYAIRELGYSESAAGRRIQAMRLVKEIPELEEKIESGALNLSNICQAQRFFREQKKSQPEQALDMNQKKEILEKLEQKSTREGERILLEIGGPQILPRERERVVSPELVELSFLANKELKAKLEDVRALLGARGAQMNLAELVAEMAKLAAERLGEQRFGKKRAATQNSEAIPTPDVGVKSADSSGDKPSSGVGDRRRQANRYISRSVKYQAWKKAEGQCSCCGSKRDLQFDHIQPFALGGDSDTNNIQLLCRSCNLRRGAIKFGTAAMHRA